MKLLVIEVTPLKQPSGVEKKKKHMLAVKSKRLPRRRSVSGENAQRVIMDESTVTRWALLLKVFPSNDSESDPLKVACFRV